MAHPHPLPPHHGSPHKVNKVRIVKRAPAKFPSSKELGRILPHDERLPRAVSRPPKRKHMVVVSVIVAILLIAGLLLTFLHVLPWKVNQGDAAIVNGERLSVKEAAEAYSVLPQPIKDQFSEFQFLNETVIPQMLIVQEAARRGITVSDDEVSTVTEEILSSQNFTEEQLVARLQEMGLTQDSLRVMITKRILITKTLNATVPPQMVSEEEIKTFFSTNKDYFASTYGNITLVDAHDAIKNYLLSQKEQAALQQYVDSLRANSTIIINADLLTQN